MDTISHDPTEQPSLELPIPPGASPGRSAAATGPDFLVVGAMKSGTTSLWRYIKDHPQIQMAKGKEIHFFSSPELWEQGWEWYLSRFPERDPATIAMGEASVSYAMFPTHPEVPARIAARVPNVRLVYLVRHPIRRMQSHYLHLVRRGSEHRPIDEAFLDDEPYLNYSRYATQIKRFLEHFPKEQLLVLTAEELRAEREATLARAFTFLGVDPTWQDPVQEQEYNRGEDAVGLTPTAARIRGNPALRRLAQRAPSWLRKAGSRPVDRKQANLSAETTARVSERLAPEITALRPFIREPFDGWGIA